MVDHTKHLNDLMFYKHILNPQSKVLFPTEARVDLSLMYLRKARAELHNKLDVNSPHGIHILLNKTQISTELINTINNLTPS